MSELLAEFEHFVRLLDEVISSANRLRALLIANAVGTPLPPVPKKDAP